MNRTGRAHLGGGRTAALVAAIWLIAPAAAANIQVVVRTLDHETFTGELVEFSLEGGLVLQTQGGRETLSVASTDIVQIQHASPATSTTPPLSVVLVGGDRLFGTITGSGPDQIIMDTVIGSELAIPLDRIRACLTARASSPKWQRSTERFLSTGGDGDDRLLMSNGDVLAGFVLTIEPEYVTFEHQDRELKIRLDLIVALAMTPEPLVVGGGPRARLEFVDGSELTVSRVRWSPTGLELTFFDGTLQGLSAQAIRSVEIRGGRWRLLGGIDPHSYLHTPLLSLKWGYKINQNVMGGPLSIAGEQFRYGIGVHSRAVLTYDLGGRYREFATACGVDDCAGPYADVAASIVVDGQVKWQERHIKAGSPPHRVRISVQGARTLELKLDFGANGDLQDRFDWADAALIR